MNILLTGATGFIGQHLLRGLLAENHQVTICCRNATQLQRQFPTLKAVEMDFANVSCSDDWLEHLQHIDAVINAVGIIAASPKAGFEQVHYLAPAALFNGLRTNAG